MVCLVAILAAMLNFHKTAKIGVGVNRFDHNFNYIDTFLTNEVSKFETFHFGNFETTF